MWPSFAAPWAVPIASQLALGTSIQSLHPRFNLAANPQLDNAVSANPRAPQTERVTPAQCGRHTAAGL